MAWQYKTCTEAGPRWSGACCPRSEDRHRRLPRDPDVRGDRRLGARPGLIDFIVRGEGEEAFRRLINALDGKDRFEDIPSLSFHDGDGFVHNPRGELLDLSKLKLPIRDQRRLTDGYHIMISKVEVIETSRGCTRTCNFCSMNHMYGRTFRPFPLERILADIDDIYYQPQDPLDLRGRRQPRAGPGARHGDLRRHHRPQATAT